MPAGLPGNTLVENQANPSGGNPVIGSVVIFDPLSGPKGSPFDSKKFDYSTGTPPGWDATTKVPILLNDPLNVSSGALSTGIGYGSPPVIGPISHPAYSNAVYGIRSAGFTDDYKPGVSTPVPADSADSRYMYIGGGKDAIVDGTDTGPLPTGSNGYPPGWYTSQPVPYVTGFAIGGAGNGGSRDAGAGPAFTSFGLKTVTATGAVANGAAVEAGWVNRSNIALVADQSVFGLGTAATAAPTLDEPEDEEDEEILASGLTAEEEEELAEEDEEDEVENGNEGVFRRVVRKAKTSAKHK